MKEEWKRLKKLGSVYEVSNTGKVRSLRFGRIKILKGGLSNGYKRVSVFINKKQNSYYIHRLVAEAFLGEPMVNQVVNHKNGVKHDNRVENLEWCTQQDNVLHYRKSTQPFCRKTIIRRKLNPYSVMTILTLANSWSRTNLSKHYGVSVTLVCHIISRKRWPDAHIKTCLDEI